MPTETFRHLPIRQIRAFRAYWPVLAHELLDERLLAELPAMVTLAERSVFAACVGAWWRRAPGGGTSG
jgi:hypothetical protein